MIEVTPELATEWLAKYNKPIKRTTRFRRNRAISESYVNTLKEDMIHGRFKGCNGQTIMFSGDLSSDETRLLNGQHRLAACSKQSNVVKFLIMTGVPESDFLQTSLWALTHSSV
jgi:hypothetical protein